MSARARWSSARPSQLHPRSPLMRTVVLVMCLMLIAGCSACRSGAPEPVPVEPEPLEEAQAGPAQGDEEARPESELESGPAPEPPDPAAMAALAKAGNAFGVDLYRRVAAAPGNFAFSPMSISLAFAMTHAGARGDTAAEMRRVLRLGADDAALHDSAGRLLATWNDPSRESYELRVVNRLFGEQQYSFEQPFLDLTRETYRAPLETVDFRNAPEAQRKHINGWVAKQTRDRIPTLLPDGSIDALTRLVLVNAIYFLGSWERPFKPDATADAPFHTLAGRTRTVPMMQQVGFFGYAERDGLQLVDLPYKGDELAMTVVLPRAKKGLPSLEKGLTTAKVTTWLDSLQEHRVRVLLPRFEIRDSRIDLAEQLRPMGMRLAFDANRADFGGMSRPANPDEALYVSGAYHQTFVKVDEKGTEAAAATAVIMSARGGPPPEPPEFRADRPFLFMIRDLASGAILFIGRVVDPG
jgi:serpin B